MKRLSLNDEGFTLVEVLVSTIVLAIVVVATMGLLATFISSTAATKQHDEALSLASNKIESSKAEAYEDLVPNSTVTETKTVDNIKYSVKTLISFVDNAYDGCGSYPTQALKEKYCLNYPAPASAPNPDTNPADYKLVKVEVSVHSKQLVSLDTFIAPRVSETASSTGALFVSVITPSGTPISGADVSVKNTTVSPIVDVSGNTDSNGVVIFYGLKPDSGSDYVVAASKSGYSGLSTIAASGSLQPTYANQKILTQSSSYVTLKLALQGHDSLLVETTDVNGTPLPNIKVYVKGGYKSYIDSDNTGYYYDNSKPSDNRITTDASGLAGISDLAPINQYFFCGDQGDSGCTGTGGTQYYLAAALPYSSDGSLAPIAIPTYDPSDPPTVMYPFGSTSYLQKVRLMLTTNPSFPRVFSIQPPTVSASGAGLGNFSLTVNGYNLGSASLTLKQGSNTYSAGSCTPTGTQLTCRFDLSSITSSPNMQVIVANGAGTLTLPIDSPKGGLIVTP